MDVMYVVPDGDDLGGIYSSTENLLCGFREAGHTATFALLRPTRTAQRSGKQIVPRAGAYTGEGTGYALHPQYGWQGVYFSLGDKDSMRALVALGNAHDIVVWGAMFGLRNKLTEGTTDWLRLFKDIKRPHVCMIRDDHIVDRYPWVVVLERYGVVGWACVQRSSFDSGAALLSRPRAIIYSGHKVMPADSPPLMSKRSPQVFMMHTFKSWKRADRLVSAAPYVQKARIVLGGQGIEYFYMASETKCKPRYYCTAQNDPAASKRMLGKPIWHNALKAGMQHAGNMTASERDQMLSKSMFFLDLSWREHSTGQINRTTVEAIKCGCVPICNNRFITGRDDGNGELFKAGVHYIAAPPHDCTPKALAQFLDTCVMKTSASDYARIQLAGRALIKRFDRKTAAQQLVDLALGKVTGDDWRGKTAQHDKAMVAKGRQMFEATFGPLP